jgi:hypothetical protein
MFNQKTHGYISQNQDYLNYSYSAPQVSARDIHTCGTTIQKFKQTGNKSLPLQTWCSANVATESFAMRPIVNSKEYFDTINKYLASIIYTDSVALKSSGLSSEYYMIYDDYGYEPESSFFQAIKMEVSDRLGYYMAMSSDQVAIFKDYNPICEGFVITDIEITSYRSQQNENHFFHKILFSAFNTTRYNTISFKAEAYQDTTPMRQEWDQAIQSIMNSKNTPTNIKSSSNVYISFITLLNNTTCVTGQESACGYSGHNLNSKFSQLLNDNFLKPPTGLMWQQPDAMTQNVYNQDGNYDTDGNIRIIDYGPNNLDNLIKKLT